jgi:hypothetical protein
MDEVALSSLATEPIAILHANSAAYPVCHSKLSNDFLSAVAPSVDFVVASGCAAPASELNVDIAYELVAAVGCYDEFSHIAILERHLSKPILVEEIEMKLDCSVAECRRWVVSRIQVHVLDDNAPAFTDPGMAFVTLQSMATAIGFTVEEACLSLHQKRGLNFEQWNKDSSFACITKDGDPYILVVDWLDIRCRYQGGE